MPIQIKRDPYLWGFAALLVLITGALIWHHDVTFKEGGAFITGALAMPALFGTKKKDGDDDNSDGGVTVPVSDPTTLGKPPQVNTPILRSLVAFSVVALVVACTAAQKDALHQGADVADKGCQLVQALNDDSTVKSVCASVEEIAAIAKLLEAERPDAGPHARAAKCVVLPTTTFCATNAETAKGIDAILAQRRTWFSLDAGAHK